MSVSNGQYANQDTFNSAFMSRSADDNTLGKKDLVNADPVSGTGIINAQKNFNALCSALGITPNQAANFLMSFAGTQVGSTTSSAKDMLTALIAKFHNTTGHKHTGLSGDAPKISASDIDGLSPLYIGRQKLDIPAAVGMTYDITSLMTGKVSGGSDTTAGVVTNLFDNAVQVMNNLTDSYFITPTGAVVYGRIFYDSGTSTWGVTFFTNEGGIEANYTFASPVSMSILYREVFDGTGPKVDADIFDFISKDPTADITDASVSERGAVSLGAQTFAGNKTFSGFIELLSTLKLTEVANSTATGANASLTLPTSGIVRLTNVSLTSIDMIAAPADKKLFVLYINDTGTDITVNNLAGGTAANQINTGTGSNLKVKNGACFAVFYSAGSDKWRMLGGAGGSGSGSGTGVKNYLGLVGSNDMNGDFESGTINKWYTANGSVSTSYNTNAVIFANVATLYLGTVTVPSGHPWLPGDPIIFYDNGATANRPTNILNYVVYYVKTSAATSLTLSLTPGGATMSFTGTANGLPVSSWLPYTPNSSSITNATTGLSIVTGANALAGGSSLQWLNGGVNAGRMLVSDVFTLEPEDMGKPLAFTFSYKTILGSTGMVFRENNDGYQSYQVWVFNTTANTWIRTTHTPFKAADTTPEKVVGFFNPSGSSSTYRFAIVCVSPVSVTNTGFVVDSFVLTSAVNVSAELGLGSFTTPVAIYTGGFVEAAGKISTAAPKQRLIVRGVTPGGMTSTSTIPLNNNPGAELEIYGGNDTDILELVPGANLVINGPWQSRFGNCLKLKCVGIYHVEVGRT